MARPGVEVAALLALGDDAEDVADDEEAADEVDVEPDDEDGGSSFNLPFLNALPSSSLSFGGWLPLVFEAFSFFSFLALGLYSVITTVKSFTVTLWYVAELRSTFFNRALLTVFLGSFLGFALSLSLETRLLAFRLANAARSVSSSSPASPPWSTIPSAAPFSLPSSDAADGDLTDIPEEDGTGAPPKAMGGGVRA